MPFAHYLFKFPLPEKHKKHIYTGCIWLFQCVLGMSSLHTYSVGALSTKNIINIISPLNSSTAFNIVTTNKPPRKLQLVKRICTASYDVSSVRPDNLKTFFVCHHSELFFCVHPTFWFLIFQSILDIPLLLYFKSISFWEYLTLSSIVPNTQFPYWEISWLTYTLNVSLLLLIFS